MRIPVLRASSSGLGFGRNASRLRSLHLGALGVWWIPYSLGLTVQPPLAAAGAAAWALVASLVMLGAAAVSLAILLATWAAIQLGIVVAAPLGYLVDREPAP